MVQSLSDVVRKIRRLWRRQRAALVSLVLVGMTATVAMFVYFVQKFDQAQTVFRTEEVWSYSVFGLASVVGLMVSILILMNQTRREFGDSEELMEQLIEIARDASDHRSQLSILYPSPNPGQWTHIFRGHRGFERLRARLLEHANNERLPTRICMLPGAADSEESALGQFVSAFNQAAYIPGEPVRITNERESVLQVYQREAGAFFAELQGGRTCTISYIDEGWLGTITEGWLIILAAGHSLGFLGYMSLEKGRYRFKALPLSGSTGFLHGLFDALRDFYESPPPPNDKEH